MRTVVFVAPFGMEATLRFAKAASALSGVRLVGVMQEIPHGALRERVDKIFADVVQVDDVQDAQQLIVGVEKVRKTYGGLHRLVGILETLQVPLAIARAHFSLPGTDPDTADLFRDKARMKDRLRAAGLPVANHRLLHGHDDAIAAEAALGFPMILKPPAGMGAKSTFRVSSHDGLMGAVAGMRASPAHPILAEELLQGEEGSCDTVTVGGVPQVFSISSYRPTILEVLENPWIQWCCLLPRSQDGFDDVHDLCRRAISVLGLKDGFTHMEWFRREDGSLAIGEIAQRPPGAQISRMVGLVHDEDPYHAWAEAVIDEKFSGPWKRQYAAGTAFLRGLGQGKVSAVTGLDEVHAQIGDLVVETKLPVVGQPKSDAYEGEGYAIVRHPETARVLQALETIVRKVRVHYA